MQTIEEKIENTLAASCVKLLIQQLCINNDRKHVLSVPLVPVWELEKNLIGEFCINT